MTFTLSGTLSPRLYAEGFGEGLADAEKALSALIAAGAIPLLLEENGTPVSQGVGIPLTVDGGRILSLYALTTDKAARNRGCLRTLVEETARAFRARGYRSLCLLPANGELDAAYRRLGFTVAHPAGALPLPEGADGFSLYTEEALPFVETDDLPLLHRSLGAAMPLPLFALTIKTLADVAYPARLGEETALLSCRHPGCAIAVSEGLSAHFSRRPTASLLSLPLSGEALPPPEPLPR